jgi:hypothetical protein
MNQLASRMFTLAEYLRSCRAFGVRRKGALEDIDLDTECALDARGSTRTKAPGRSAESIIASRRDSAASWRGVAAAAGDGDYCRSGDSAKCGLRLSAVLSASATATDKDALGSVNLDNYGSTGRRYRGLTSRAHVQIVTTVQDVLAPQYRATPHPVPQGIYTFARRPLASAFCSLTRQ